MTSTDWSRSCGPIFMAFSDPVVVQDVMRGDNAEAERLIEAQRRGVGDLGADAHRPRAGDPGGRRYEVAGDAAAVKPGGDADEVDRRDALARTEQLGEPGHCAVALGDDHVIAAAAGEEIAGPFGAATIGDLARNCGIE